ncbi:Ig-like domain-containing protein [Gordonia sp. KTR9]|uniref:Ig-like domain-containing protein n=1 Tax=Gordonia sp. KTR9 TaxID=337191 RepID=UPI0011D2216A|nr:Ig-like domain-containing protein [Gordonia sp. KTR9]
MNKLKATRRVVASSGIAAALLAAAPIGLAIADPSTTTAQDSESTTQVASSDTGTDDTEPNASASSDEDSPADNTDVSTPETGEPATGSASEHDAGDQDSSPDSLPPSGVDSADASPPTSGPAATEQPDGAADVDAPPAEQPSTGWGEEASGDDPASSDASEQPSSDAGDAGVPPEQGAPDEPVAETAAPDVAPSALAHFKPALPVVFDAPDLVNNPIRQLFYRLTDGPGGEGLVLLNQGAVAFAVLNRRARGNGEDYVGLLGPGDKMFLPRTTVAELTLGKHTWDREASEVDMTDDTVRAFLARSVVAVTNALVTFGDPDDRFVNVGEPITADPIYLAPPAGVSYSIPASSGDGVVTIHNNSDQDIAVHDVYDLDDTSFVVIHPGGSYTIPASVEPGTLFGSHMYRVQGVKQDGAMVVIGMIQTEPTSGMVTSLPTATVDGQLVGLPLHGIDSPDYGLIDPSDLFHNPGETAPTFVPTDPIDAGISYTVGNGDTVTIYNDGDHAIAVTQTTLGGQTIGFKIVDPGDSVTWNAVPGGGQLTVTGGRGTGTSAAMYGTILDYPNYAPASNPAGDTVSSIPVRATGPVNHAPVGSITIGVVDPETGSAIVTVDFTDEDGDPLTYTASAIHGTVTDNGDGTFTYRPDPDYAHAGAHTDIVVVTASDGHGGTRSASAEVQVSKQNAAPTGSFNASTPGDRGIIVYTPNFTDTDGDPLYYQVTGNPQHGTVEVGIDGTVVYTPDRWTSINRPITDDFTVTVTDNHGGTTVVPVTVEVPLQVPQLWSYDWWRLADPTNRFMTPDDSLIGQSYDVLANPRIWGVSFAPGGTHDTLTITNDGDQAIAVWRHNGITPTSSVGPDGQYVPGYNYVMSIGDTADEFVIIEPGSTHTFDTSEQATYVVYGERLDDGRTPLLGFVVAEEGKAYSSPVRGAIEYVDGGQVDRYLDTIPKTRWLAFDPDDRFFDISDPIDPSDTLFDPNGPWTVSYENGSSEGITYEHRYDADTGDRVIVIRNGSDGDIMVTPTIDTYWLTDANGSVIGTSGPPEEAEDPIILNPGETYEFVYSDYFTSPDYGTRATYLLVQGERDELGRPVRLGTIGLNAFRGSDGTLTYGAIHTQLDEYTGPPANSLPEIDLTVNSPVGEDHVTYTIVASDPDGDTVTHSVSPTSNGGRVVVNADGTVTYTASPSHTGWSEDSFTITSDDGNGGIVRTTVRVGAVTEVVTAADGTTGPKPGAPVLVFSDVDQGWAYYKYTRNPGLYGAGERQRWQNYFTEAGAHTASANVVEAVQQSRPGQAVANLVQYFTSPEKIEELAVKLVGQYGLAGKAAAYSYKIGQLVNAAGAGDATKATSMLIGLFSDLARDGGNAPARLFGIATTVYQYVGEQAAQTDFELVWDSIRYEIENPGDTFIYAITHPAETATEFGNAAAEVAEAALKVWGDLWLRT